MDIFTTILSEINEIKNTPTSKNDYNDGWIAACNVLYTQMQQMQKNYEKTKTTNIDTNWVPYDKDHIQPELNQRVLLRIKCVDNTVAIDIGYLFESMDGVYWQTTKGIIIHSDIIEWQPLPE